MITLPPHYFLSELKYFTQTLTGQVSGLELEQGALEVISQPSYSDFCISYFPRRNVFIELLGMDKDNQDFVLGVIRNARTSSMLSFFVRKTLA